jgi:hypothetical protein
MADNVRDLLLEITRCPASTCLGDRAKGEPCSKIVHSQEVSFSEHQVPEPWSGHLSLASILFLSSNPSISPDEDYPRWSWSDHMIADFFECRFGGGEKQWIRDGTYNLNKDGSYPPRPTRFWCEMKRRAQELLQKEPIPGEDYALSEVVHCKSRSEQGVTDAVKRCADLYLHRLLSYSGAKVIVCLGRFAQQVVRETFSIPESVRVHGPVAIGQRDRVFAFLPHPNARAVRSFVGCMKEDEVNLLRGAIAR